jgi:hypothetical protein
MAENPQNPAAFKSQPWQLFDTIAARSFLLGDGTNGLAIGSQVPAISANGEIIFFQSSGRTRANMPWYTNLDVAGQLAYGFQVWQIFVNIMFPLTPAGQSVDPQSLVGGVPGPTRLAEAILNFGVLSLNLGQEDQIEWPLSRFGAGGGLAVVAGAGGPVAATNSMPQSANVMKLPEPIEMGRTQNLSAKIKLAPEVFAIIGSVAAPGVGQPLSTYSYTTVLDEVPTVVQRQLPPFAIQLGLVGRRVKNTQYGQLVR